jgi:dihydrofolate reductase
MTRKLNLYIATSLNSRISTADGSVAWLETIPHPKDEDYGYQEFYKTVDTTIMGYSTYAQLKGWDIPWPYKDKKNYVITRKKDLPLDDEVEFISSNHAQRVNELKNEAGKDIWVVGGGQINTMMLNAGLIDQIYIHIMPIILNGGIELFEAIPDLQNLELISSKPYSSGVMELRYKVGTN